LLLKYPEFFKSKSIIFLTKNVFLSVFSLKTENFAKILFKKIEELENRYKKSKSNDFYRLSLLYFCRNRFSDDLARAILSYNGYEDTMKRFEAFATYIDVIDPERERPHLILPFLAR
jgi:oligoribonuclease NrnB/cAMP/cGMP phosphodiesterase (DHH superfamily)